MRSCWRGPGRVLLAVALAATAAARPAAQQPAPAQPPVFGGGVELVRLDVVVLDRDGRPVSGLGRDDFEVEEEGQPQAITSFEPVVIAGARHPAVAEPPRLTAARLRAPSEGRCLLLFVDDIHLSPPVAETVRRSLQKFLQEDVREGDWVTVLAPWQQLWWTARNGWEYRQLAAALEGVKGHGSGDTIGDWAQLRAVEYGQMGTGGESAAVTGDPRAGSGGPGRFAVVGDANAPVQQEMAIAQVRRRTEVTLGGLQQALESLVRLRGHKSLVLISEGFLLLPRMRGYQEAIDVARRANVAVHFIDPRGVQAEQTGTELARTLGDVEGLTAVTGGTVFSGNEVEAGLRRVASESDAYYLLGYEPARPGGGERRLQVRVKRAGLTVRARTRYYAASPQPAAAGKPGRRKGKEPAEAAPALAAMRSLSDSTDLPLRVSTLFFEANRRGEVATMLATEVVPPPGPDGERLFKLASEARSRNGGPPVLDRFEGSPKVTSGVPVILARQWNLTPGVWQLRLLVEDTATRRVGTLVHTFEVPQAKGFRISTPILTAEIDDPNGKRKPKVALGRTFRSGTILYCQYSAYGAPVASAHDWVPHVFGSWTLQRGEQAIRESPPTLIQPAPDGRLTRTLGISLQGLPPGEYALVLSVRDQTTGERLTRTEPFTVAP